MTNEAHVHVRLSARETSKRVCRHSAVVDSIARAGLWSGYTAMCVTRSLVTTVAAKGTS